MKQLIRTLVLGLLLGALPEVLPAQQLMPSDSTYRALKSQIEGLDDELEQLELQLNTLRQSYRQEPARREELTPSILEAEGRLLTLQGERTSLKRQTEAFEQQWSLQHLDKQGVESPEERSSEHSPLLERYASAPRHRNLVYNACFEGELPREDYLLLRATAHQEQQAAKQVEYFAENYQRLVEMQQSYFATTEQGVADSLYDRMNNLLVQNNQIDEELGLLWGEIFDQKSYSYSYLLEVAGCETQLEKQIEMLNTAQAEAESARGEYASDALADYFIRKRALVRCEQQLARTFDLRPSLDSLTRELEYLLSVEYRLPRIQLSRRYLLDYSPITFAEKCNYTANSVPATEIHEHGTIYRIRLGSYKYRQQPSIFRKVEPLSLNRESGRYVYYAGGFATKREAREACDLLRDKGFRAPVIVRWQEGVSEEVAEQAESRYRVEIRGVQSLTDAMREAIRRVAPNKELARIGSNFVVGPFEDLPVAESLLQELRRVDGSVEVALVEVEE